MTGWYIAGGILLLLAALLASPLRAEVFFREELRLRLGWMFLSFQVLPPKEEKPEKKKKPRKKKSSGKKPPAPAKKPEEKKPGGLALLKEIFHYEGVPGLFAFLKDLAGIAAGTAKKLFAHLTVKKFDLLVVVGGEDAAETALQYGKLCGAVYPAVSMLLSACKCRRYGVTIVPDFDARETQAVFSARVKIRVIFLLWYGIGALWAFVRRLVRENTQLQQARETSTPSHEPVNSTKTGG